MHLHKPHTTHLHTATISQHSTAFLKNTMTRANVNTSLYSQINKSTACRQHEKIQQTFAPQPQNPPLLNLIPTERTAQTYVDHKTCISHKSTQILTKLVMKRPENGTSPLYTRKVRSNFYHS